MPNLCLCDSALPFASCCEPILNGSTASTAQALMRSRFTAYALGQTDYLLQSWHRSTRPPSLELNPKQKWLGLKIKDTAEGDEESYVEFVARFKINGRGHRLHERSRFRKEEGIWYYIDGELSESTR